MIQEILKYGKSLQEFETPGIATVFEDAKQYPQFFKNNLVDDARIIKVFKNDPQANIRVFYYQYLKLCFQLDCDNVEQYISKIENLITNPQFHFLFPQEEQLQIFNDKQFKRLFIEFFDILNEETLSVDQALAKYPIADTVMVFFFRTLLIFGGKTQNFDDFIDKTQVYQFLISYFGVQVNIHQNCLKFVETDIFVYQQQKNTVFMVYIDYDNKDASNIFQKNSQVQKVSQKSFNDSQDNSSSQQTKKHNKDKVNNSQIKIKQLRKDSFLSKEQSCFGEFVDFTQDKNQDNEKYKKKDNVQIKKSGFKPINQYQVISHASTRQNQEGLKMNSKASYVKNSNVQPIVLKQQLLNNSNSKNTKNQKNNIKQKFQFLPITQNKFQTKAALSSLQKDFTALTNKSYYTNSINYQNPLNSYDTKLDKFVGDIHQSYINNSPNKNQNFINSNKVMISTAQFGYNYENEKFSPIKGYNTIDNYNNKVNNLYSHMSFEINSPISQKYKLKLNNQTISRYEIKESSTFKNQIQNLNKNFCYASTSNNLPNCNPLSTLKQSQYTYTNTLNIYEHGSNKAYMKGINITKQFTNSIILKSIIEPHRSIIQNMKARARAARDSIQRKF